MGSRSSLRLLVVSTAVAALLVAVPAATQAASPSRTMDVSLSFRSCAADIFVQWSNQPGRADSLRVQLTDTGTAQALAASFTDGRSGYVNWVPELATAAETHRFIATAQLVDSRGRTVAQASSSERVVSCQFTS
jgi:hypothetical protein